MNKRGFYEKYIKRPQDFFLAVVALLVLSLPLILIAGLIMYKLGKPVIFRQKRPGLDEKIFTIYKFRTMIDKYDANGKLLEDAERLTPFGKFLRSTSIDELPELWNVIKGDMTIIGPRPLLVEYLPRYNSVQKRRHEVKPGIYGLAQISGRNKLSWENKFDLDIEYIENISFYMDWKIIFLTVKKVFIREGINSDSSATMEVFRGAGGDSEK